MLKSKVFSPTPLITHVLAMMHGYRYGYLYGNGTTMRIQHFKKNLGSRTEPGLELGEGGQSLLFEDFRDWDINAREGKVTISLLGFHFFFFLLKKTILSHNLQINKPHLSQLWSHQWTQGRRLERL